MRDVKKAPEMETKDTRRHLYGHYPAKRHHIRKTCLKPRHSNMFKTPD
jgi:hypothetical protein